jgi:hypothetical protein
MKKSNRKNKEKLLRRYNQEKSPRNNKVNFIELFLS